MDKTQHDAWTNADAYEAYVGRWSRLTAEAFLTWLASPAQVWLDLGCGTGVLSEAMLKQAAPRQLIGVEPSEGFLARAKAKIRDERVSFALGSGAAIPVADASIDMLVSGYVLNFIPALAEALAEMKRALKPGGTLAAYVWDYAEKAAFMRVFWDAATRLDARAAAFDEGRRFSICRPERLSATLADAGLEQLEVQPLDILTHFKDFDDYWQPFLGGIGSAPGYVASLSAEQRHTLRGRIREALPISSDGSIALSARSWAVKGVVKKENEMFVVRFEHPVPDVAMWKQAFDRDPADRKGSGVKCYQALRAQDDPSDVLIDLEVERPEQVEAFLETMQRIWAGPGKAVLRNPKVRVAELVEAKEV